MRVSQVHFQNFKRFTDLVIKDIPREAKLVLVVGPNGSGKSSLFDGFLHWYRYKADFGIIHDELYFRKQPETDFDWTRSVDVRFHDGREPSRGCLYIRTAHRNDPEFTVTGIKRQEAPYNQVPVQGMRDRAITWTLLCAIPLLL